ncbi:MAG: STM3941 family protein [Pseudomonadota bacterium]
MVLLPPRFEQWWVLAICAVFAAIGLWIVIEEPEAWGGWLCLLFFGFGCLAMAARGLFRRSFRLELHRDRFVAYHPRRVSTVRWVDVEGFDAWSHGATSLVGWELREGARREAGVLNRANRAISGLDGTLPSLYGFPPDVLAALLEEWQRRCLDDGEAGQPRDGDESAGAGH